MFRLSRKRRSRRTVRQDWHAELSAEKLKVYEYALGEVHPAHVIYSVALNEAISLEKLGHVAMAREQAHVSADLCDRFAGALESLIRALEQHAQHFGTLPSVKPLDPIFFEGETAKKAASMNSLLSRVLFREHSRFLHKLSTLGEIASDIGEEYRVVATEVAEGARNSAKQGWQHLSNLQFDLTTSLHETTVVLKSFLVSLPGEEVPSFRDRLVLSLAAAPVVVDARTPVYRRE